ncbi:MAG: hypothetical protein U0522_01275 [Candidatus Paceibacterota bacterium]
MTNLLPQPEQMAIKKEYKYRRSIVFVLMFVFTMIVGAGFLLPSLILSNIKLKTVSFEAEKARTANEQRVKDNASVSTLKETESKLALLNTSGVGGSVVSVVDLITKEKSPNIRIREISYEGGVSGKITISGLSKDRESLTDFLHQMQAISIFKLVDLPVSNFAKDKDISFSMQISGTF